MSYRRSYSQRIALHYSGSVNYPASQSGGSASYSGTVYEDINVNIDVDTTPFDQSIQKCNHSVDLLTGAVVATEAAQIASINENAQKVAGTIVKGFFTTVHTAISQQISELSKKIDSYILHLHELTKSCSDIQKRMETDHNRISNKWMKIFNDLNKELENRIFELNKPAFTFKNSIDRQVGKMGNSLVGTVAISGPEGGELQNKIGASLIKKQTFETISQAKIFLWKQKKLDTTISRCMLSENIAKAHFSPVCFLETYGYNNQIGKNVHQSDLLLKTNPDVLIEKFANQNWTATEKEKKDNIQRYFNMELNQAYPVNNHHDNRVKEMILKIFNINEIKSNNNMSYERIKGN